MMAFILLLTSTKSKVETDESFIGKKCQKQAVRTKAKQRQKRKAVRSDR